MLARTADDRIKAAREAIKNDISVIDRQELASMLMDMAVAIAKEAKETRQLSNAIGGIRLIGELGGLTGQNKVWRAGQRATGCVALVAGNGQGLRAPDGCSL